MCFQIVTAPTDGIGAFVVRLCKPPLPAEPLAVAVRFMLPRSVLGKVGFSHSAKARQLFSPAVLMPSRAVCRATSRAASMRDSKSGSCLRHADSVFSQMPQPIHACLCVRPAARDANSRSTTRSSRTRIDLSWSVPSSAPVPHNTVGV